MGQKVVVKMPRKMVTKGEVQKELNTLLEKLQPFYEHDTAQFVDDVARAAAGRHGMQAALAQIRWAKIELEEFETLNQIDSNKY